ncbi:MORN repeat-containing protein, partial [Ruminococcaceae bacterium P7]
DKINGHGKKTYAAGNVIEGEYVNGYLNGYGTAKYIDGSHYEGMFKNGNYHGQEKTLGQTAMCTKASIKTTNQTDTAKRPALTELYMKANMLTDA